MEVTAARIRHERQTLCERMQDDYGIELAAAEVTGSEERGARSRTKRTQVRSLERVQRPQR